MCSVLFLLLLHFWKGRAVIIHHDVYIYFVIDMVPHIMVEETRFGHFKIRLMWDMDDKLIPILDVSCH